MKILAPDFRKRYFSVAILILLLFIHTISLWVIDVSVSVIVSGGVLVGLFGAVANPVLTYHIGTVLNMFTAVIIVIYAAGFIVIENRERKK